MKKLFCILFTLLFTVGFCTVASAEMTVSSMDITVTLQDDGSAVIEQVWETYADENTEFYYPFGTGEYLSLSDFSVGDKTKRAYRVIDDWDIDASFDEKAYTCGLNPIDGGYEVCWGVSRYGENRYVIRYTVHNMVGSYADTDGFLFRFVNSEMNTTPTDVSLTIRMANGADITDATCNIWGFGYDGDVVFYDGGIKAKTDYPIEYDNHMTLMVEFNKGVLHPTCEKDGSFADVKALAFEDSDYDPNAVEDDGFIAFLVIMGVLLCGFGTLLTIYVVHRVQIKKFIKKCDYHRDLPLDNNLNAAAKLGVIFGIVKEEQLIGAYLLRMINDGNIRPLTTEEIGAFGKTNKNTDIMLVREPAHNSFAEKLFEILYRGADESGLVTQKAMKRICKRQHSALRAFLKKALSMGETWLDQNGYSDKLSPVTLGHLTEKGKQHLAEIAGFKKYLEDFSLLNEHEIGAAPVWREYMVWAVLFGIADKVIDQLKHIYPEKMEEWDVYTRHVIITRGYSHGMYASMRAREQQLEAQRSGGSGGRASFGGGGGFSGGGVGGGGR
ncbi:MAG: DUF2207 domain-containing protein [Clostridia bacterium]|nr:DUF2207 domain-containing protein [Clostridia bacterium]